MLTTHQLVSSGGEQSEDDGDNESDKARLLPQEAVEGSYKAHAPLILNYDDSNGFRPCLSIEPELCGSGSDKSDKSRRGSGQSLLEMYDPELGSPQRNVASDDAADDADDGSGGGGGTCDADADADDDDDDDDDNDDDDGRALRVLDKETEDDTAALLPVEGRPPVMRQRASFVPDDEDLKAAVKDLNSLRLKRAAVTTNVRS
jgi:hypothetical protein